MGVFAGSSDPMVRAQLIKLGVIGLMCAVICFAGLAWFMRAEWFRLGGPFPEGWEGFTAGEFVGVMLFSFFYIPAFTLLFVVLQHWTRLKLATGSAAVPVSIAVIVLLTLAGLGFYWGWPVLKCGLLFCLNPVTYPTPPYPPVGRGIPLAGIGYQTVVGISTFLACSMLAISVLCAYFNRHTPAENKSGASVGTFRPLSSGPRVLTTWKRDRCGEWTLFGTYLLVLFAFFLTTTYLPNTWEYFSPDRIASGAAMRTSPHPEICTRWPKWTCPEYEWGSFITQNIELTPYWVLKIFPSNLFFYLFLALTPLGGLLWRYSEASANRKIKLFGRHFSSGELLFIAATGLVTFLWMWYWVQSHNYNGYWPSKVIFESEKWARALGQLAVLFMSLLMIPVARTSLLPAFFGTTWEATMQYHRWLGWLFLLATLAHVGANWVWYYETGHFPQDIFAVPMHLSTSIDNWTVPHITLVVWFSLLAIGVPAIYEPFRRKWFEVFYYLHHLAFSLLIPAVLWHAAAAPEFLVPPTAIWFIDRCIRAYRSSQVTDILDMSVKEYGLSGEVIKLTLRPPRNFRFYPGQYVFLNVAQLSLLEWHPFTIGSANATEVVLYIRSSGTDTWTGRLVELGKMRLSSPGYASGVGSHRGQMTISMDGPYGTPLDFSDYERVFLVAGGIGITPAKALLESFCHQHRAGELSLRRVHVLWSVRDVRMLEIVHESRELFGDVEAASVDGATTRYSSTADASAVFTGDFYHSLDAPRDENKQSDLLPGLVAKLRSGRPDIPAVLAQLHDMDVATAKTNESAAPRTLVFVCGPPGMVDDAEDTARRHNWHFHTETFLL